jgi:Chitinase class I
VEEIMPINREFFFYHAKLHLFDGSFKQSQVDGLTAVLDKWEADSPKDDDRWLAYMLGTAHHETGRTMQPVRETFASSDDQAIARLNKAFGAGKLVWVKKPYWLKDDQGKSWLGRGLVQLTHKANYQKMSDVTGVDLVADPTLAMDMSVAVKIMFAGMRKGSFTGAKLSDFFSPSVEKWRDARKIINGLESADLVAGYARRYYAAISYTVA